MRILLLSLPCLAQNNPYLFPLGIGYLAGSLKDKHTVNVCHITDFRNISARIKGFLANNRPDVIGVSCNTFNRDYVKEAVRLIRSINRHIKIVLGGIHSSFCYEQVLQSADIVVIGEGERTFVSLCEALEHNISLESIPGIAFKDGRHIVTTKHADFLRDIDTLPMPDYSYAAPLMEKSKMGFVITSRGCPVRCTFCSTSSFWGQKVRMHSVRRVVDEMEMLIRQFKVKKIFFHDDTFNLSIDRIKNICAEIKNRNLNVEWGCTCRVTPVSQEMLSSMVETGCSHICWGIESGSERMLRSINKKITLSQIRHAFETSAKFNDVMSCGAFMTLGNPGETESSIQETVQFLNSIPLTDMPSASILCILPGATLYNILKRKGYIKDLDWLKSKVIPFYTIEHSYRTLQRWLTMVRNSGKRISFDSKKHFWYKVMMTSDLNIQEGQQNKIQRFIWAIIKPNKLVKFLFRKIHKHLSGRIIWL